MIESGKKEGAKVETGGSKVGDTGYFVYPTVFSNVTDEMKIAREEVKLLLLLKNYKISFIYYTIQFQIFGPVQQIIKFKTLDEAIERANKTNYGLAAGILSKNINTVLKYIESVDAGSVW